MFGISNHCSNLLLKWGTVSSKGESGQCVNQPPFKFPAKMRYSQFEVGKQESRQLGNLKQFSRLWRGILGGICSPEPQSCVRCVNQPPLKFPAKMRYSQFKVGRWESGHLGIRTKDIGNLKQLSRLQCGILDSICSLDPHNCVEVCQSTTVQISCPDAVQSVQSGEAGKQACGKFKVSN
jgi:hypothetical protein